MAPSSVTRTERDGRQALRHQRRGVPAAAKASTDPTVSAFAGSLTSATDADLFVAAGIGYPVAYRGGFGGAFAPLTFDGDLTVQIDVTGMNARHVGQASRSVRPSHFAVVPGPMSHRVAVTSAVVM